MERTCSSLRGACWGARPGGRASSGPPPPGAPTRQRAGRRAQREPGAADNPSEREPAQADKVAPDRG